MIVSPLYLFTFLSAFLLSLLLTRLTRGFALSRGMVAMPREDRWHKKPVALLGGVSIYLTILLAWGLLHAIDSMFHGFSPLQGCGTGRLTPLLLAMTAMFLLGLLDDILEMRPQHKLIGQIVIACVVVIFGFQVEWFVSKTANVMVSIFWIVGITNAFNLLDNMDGLSVGVAFLAGLFLFWVSLPTVESLQGLLLLTVFLGALLGFLVFNFHPASIFMGDSGSLMIGLTLALLTTKGSGIVPGATARGPSSMAVIPVFILLVPILDTFFVTVMRKLFGRPISQGGLDHSSHRMVALGLSERSAVLVLYAFSAASGLLAIAISGYPATVSVALVTLFLLLVIFFWIHLARVKVYGGQSIIEAKNLKGLMPLLVDITYRKRVFEILLDLVIIPLAYWSAYLLRFGDEDYARNFAVFLKSLPIVVACQLAAFHVTGVYRGLWRYLGLSDVITYGKAVTLGAVAAVIINLVVFRFVGFSRAVFVIYWMILLILVVASRFSFRLLSEATGAGRRLVGPGAQTLIYGADAAGQLVLTEMGHEKVQVVGFLDDDETKQGNQFLGYPVLGGVREIEEVAGRYGVSRIVVTTRGMDKAMLENLKRRCEGLDIKVSYLKISLEE
jgi:UDP-GlcNAc:undecaprenyl-phosphate GlcNAc-1-phosphate transferase